MYGIVSCIVLVAIFWALNAFLLYSRSSSEGFLGSPNTVFSKGARGYGFSWNNPTRTTLSSQGCRMPADYSASELPYCEMLEKLEEKTACYAGCVEAYPGGIRGFCHPNILTTYNKYAYQLDSPHFRPRSLSVCTENDPCCSNPQSSFGVYNFLATQSERNILNQVV
jgi:hypothetical protein